MNCPKCGSKTRITGTKRLNERISRCRECVACNHTETTYEVTQKYLDSIRRKKVITKYSPHVRVGGRLMKIGEYDTKKEAEQAEKTAIKGLAYEGKGNSKQVFG